jgi:hypothetical protein
LQSFARMDASRSSIVFVFEQKKHKLNRFGHI